MGLHRRPEFLWVFSAIILGAFFAAGAARYTDLQMREALILHARIASAAIDTTWLTALQGGPDDLETVQYQRLKETLARLKQSQDTCRFVYLTGERPDGTIFFIADNEPPGSEDESPPGQVYKEATEDYRQATRAGTTLVEGPVGDRWGTWVTGLVPIKDPDSGETLAMLGWDIDAHHWRWDVILGASRPTGLIVAFLVVLLAAFYILRSKQALRTSEERYRELIEGMGDVVLRVTPVGEIVFANYMAEKVLAVRVGGGRVPLVGDVVHHDDRERTRQWFKSCMRDHSPKGSIENRLVNLNTGDTCYMHWTANFRYSTSNTLLSIDCIGRDVTERKRTEEALRLTRFSVERVEDAVYWITSDARLIDVNEAACRALGYDREELLQLHVPDVDLDYDDARWMSHWDELKTQGALRLESRHRTKSGDIFPVEIIANFILFDGREINCAIVRNMTASKLAAEERLSLERQVQHSQKLESLGVLAGGIAHDFNNILAAVMGHAELALLELPESHAATANIHEISKGAGRAADLTRQMLAYSGRGKFLIEPVDLSAVAEDMVHLLRTSIPRSIALNLNLAESLPNIEGDSAQLQQVVMNLITNASESIAGENGAISLTTGMEECDASYLSKSLSASGPENDRPRPGVFVYVEVTDTGTGMDDDTISHLFEPFFTTKFTGRGLGMSAVLGIVRSHRGAILLDTSPGVGTTFRVLFPATGQPKTITDGSGFSLHISEGVGAAKGSVLVVDDELAIRNLASTVLQRKGIPAIEAGNGEAAVTLFEMHHEDILFVLLDLTMPKMGGEACLAALHKIRPDVPVVLMSGYDERDAVDMLSDNGFCGFVHKPFRLSTLSEKIDEVLASMYH